MAVYFKDLEVQKNFQYPQAFGSFLELEDESLREQVEEEKNDNDVITQLKMAGSSAGTLLMIDKYLGKRGEAD